MSHDMNIRAAKALGCHTFPTAHGYIDAEPLKGLLQMDLHWVQEHESVMLGEEDCKTYLKFTTSYDWAMLGVAEIVKRGYEIQYLYHLMKQIYPSQITFKATPEQITQAWVEVLENE